MPKRKQADAPREPQHHCVQFCVPGSPWVWLTRKGTGTMDPDAAHDFGVRSLAEAHARSMTGPRSSLQAKYVARSSPQIMPQIAKPEEVTILRREDKRQTWRQYLVVTDARVAIVEMLPAYLGGWRFHSVTVQAGDDWPNRTRDQIVAWQLANNDGLTTIVDAIDSDFRVKLLAIAKSGRIERNEEG